MTLFDDAAHNATCGISRVMPFWGDQDSEQIEQEITKHYADLAETFGLLCELARAMQGVSNNRGAINLCKTVGMAINPEWIDKANAAEKSIVELLANPRIAALLAEKKG